MFHSLRLVPLFSLAAVAGLSVACRDSGSGDDVTNPDAATDGATAGTTIQEVQSDTMAPGTPVELKGKIVTAIDNFGARKGNFWVQEEGGGEFSGVLVFGAPVEQVALLAVGDKVDISGAEKTEFALVSDTSGRTTTELQPVTGGAMTVTKVGTGTVPAPHVLDALAAGRMDAAARDAEFEKWEGVLVTVNNVSVLRGISQIGGTMPDPTFREFTITGPLRVDSSLAAIPSVNDGGGATDLVALGDCVASVTGIGDYFFNYKVLPRATADIATGGSGCPAAENTMATCMDTVDNDANGFADCMDNACATFCSTGSTTIEMVQSGAATGIVTLEDVIVSAVDLNGANNMGFYVQQSAQAAANQGLLIFTASTAPTVTIGQHVTITGMVKEFDSTMPAVGDTLTEITNPTITPVAGTTTPVPLAGIGVNTLKDISAVGEPYESVLVTLTNMKVMSNTVGNDRIQLSNGTDTIIMDDDVFNYASADYAVNTCFATVTGVMGLNTFDDERRVFPRTAADLVAGTGCP